MAPSIAQTRSRSNRKSSASVVPPASRISSSLGRVSKPTSAKTRLHIGKENECIANETISQQCPSPRDDPSEQKEILCKVESGTTTEEQISAKESSSRFNVKRKRSDVQGDDNDNDESARQVQAGSMSNKKFKVTIPQLLTPPSSEHGTDSESSRSPIKSIFRSGRRNVQSRRVDLKVHFSPTKTDLPETLQNCISMHAAFLKALSLHYAHNGAATPAELGDLMTSTTRIWKKATITQADVQRMLALYELGLDSSLRLQLASNEVQEVEWRYSPFKMVTSGFGYNVRTNIERVAGGDFSGTSEKVQQKQYEDLVLRVYQTLKEDGSSCLPNALPTIPLLAPLLGAQTQSYRTKASNTRAEILSKSKAGKSVSGRQTELSFSSLSISDGTNEEQGEHVTATVKSRTLSLFDRVRAKNQIRANTATPTSEQITRRHAIDRIPEVVEYLRMKQSQKQQVVQPAARSSFLSDLDLDDGSSYRPTYRNQHRSPLAPASTSAAQSKISFSLAQVIREVRESVPVPVSEEEVRVVVKILAGEMSTELCGWIQTFQLGSVTSVTLTGSGIGMSGVDVRKLVEEKEKTKV